MFVIGMVARPCARGGLRGGMSVAMREIRHLVHCIGSGVTSRQRRDRRQAARTSCVGCVAVGPVLTLITTVSSGCRGWAGDIVRLMLIFAGYWSSVMRRLVRIPSLSGAWRICCIAAVGLNVALLGLQRFGVLAIRLLRPCSPRAVAFAGEASFHTIVA